MRRGDKAQHSERRLAATGCDGWRLAAKAGEWR